jgi:hypothetical protein
VSDGKKKRHGIEEKEILRRVEGVRKAVLRIRMFRGLTDPDSLERGHDPDLDPSIIKQN